MDTGKRIWAVELDMASVTFMVIAPTTEDAIKRARLCLEDVLPRGRKHEAADAICECIKSHGTLDEPRRRRAKGRK